MEKRKKKKAELDKSLGLVKGIVERDIKLQNRRSEDEFIELDKLNPLTAKFAVSEDLKSILN